MEGKGTLHERWLQRTETAYRRMFEGKSQEELVTLTERETMAVLIGRELAAFLLEEHVSLDAAAQPAPGFHNMLPEVWSARNAGGAEGRQVAHADHDHACG